MFQLACKHCGQPMSAIAMDTPPPEGTFDNNTIQCDRCQKTATYGAEAQWVES